MNKSKLKPPNFHKVINKNYKSEFYFDDTRFVRLIIYLLNS